MEASILVDSVLSSLQSTCRESSSSVQQRQGGLIRGHGRVGEREGGEGERGGGEGGMGRGEGGMGGSSLHNMSLTHQP